MHQITDGLAHIAAEVKATLVELELRSGIGSLGAGKRDEIGIVGSGEINQLLFMLVFDRDHGSRRAGTEKIKGTGTNYKCQGQLATELAAFRLSVASEILKTVGKEHARQTSRIFALGPSQQILYNFDFHCDLMRK